MHFGFRLFLSAIIAYTSVMGYPITLIVNGAIVFVARFADRSSHLLFIKKPSEGAANQWFFDTIAKYL
jgi:hypothetical protein